MFVSVVLFASDLEMNGTTFETRCRITATCLGGTKEVVLEDGYPQTLTFDGVPQAAKVNKKRLRRAAIKQEEQVAQKHGGHRNKGSGSISYLKGDARIRHKYRIENKFTTKQEIKVTRGDLLKIRSECTPGECPVFQIDFKTPGTLKTEDQWVLVPLKEWEKKIATPDD